MKNSVLDSPVRVITSLLLTLAGVALLCVVPVVETTPAQTATGGTINPTSTSPVTWTGTTVSPGGNTAESTCMDSGAGKSCEIYTLTVGGAPSDWVSAGKRVQVLLSWSQVANEYDIYIHQGSSTAGQLVTSAVAGPGLTSQVAYIDVGQFGTGVYTIHVAYATTPASATDEYHGSVTAVSSTPSPAPTATADPGPKVGFENFEAPGVLTQVTGTSNGAVTVEYLGRNAGEPSVGVNPKTDVANMQSDLETLFITFNDSNPPTGPKAAWVNRRAPTSQVIDSDPIGYTDRQTGRVFASELTALSPDTAKMSFSDDDGQNWTVGQGSGLASAVDHQTVGGGPYHAPLSSNLPAGYPRSTYYCSQDLVSALCSRSDDGGLTFGASVPIYNLTECGSLHGHVKVGPDGSVYVPNKNCNGEGAVAVSEDNGVTWNVRTVHSATVDTAASVSDPSVAIDAGNRVYFADASNNSSALVAMSDDEGRTWKNIVDVAPFYALQNVKYPTAVGGDAGRAAFAFYGSTTAGSSEAGEFTGVWHLYVAETFDGGTTWTVNDATPNFPIQRGGIWTQGGGNIYRNLLDFFDITVDHEGRVVVGYVNGCAGGNCAQAAPTANGNAFSATATIARQSSGRRLFASYDPGSAATVPGMPFVTQRRINTTTHLSWSNADTGNSPLTGYQILRGTAPGAETLLTTLPAAQTSFDDSTAISPGATYYYEVLAVNAVGASNANNEIVAPYVGDTCNGVVIHKNDPAHPEATGGQAGPPPAPELLIDTVAVGEPYRANASLLMFKMKVGDLTTIPPNSRWRFVWDSNTSPGQQYYAGMTSDAASAITFEYGTLATATVGLLLGVPTETKVATADAASNFLPDGTITVYVPKSGVGSPQPGDLLGAVNGRTFTGDTPSTNTLERSTTLVDHTFVKAQTDNTYPTATYTLAGNLVCSVTGAISRKTHGTAGTFDIPLPTTGTPAVECRTGPTAGSHQIVVSFASAINAVNSVAVTPTPGAAAAIAGTPTMSGNQLVVNLTGVSNAQTVSLNLFGVSDGASSANLSIPVSFLLGDVNASGRTDSGDQTLVSQAAVSAVDATNFRLDVNTSGRIDNGDLVVVSNASVTALPLTRSTTNQPSVNARAQKKQ